MSFQELKKGTVTSPRGFLAAGLHCGIKTKSQKPDLALIVSDTPAISAGTFTVNRIKAWPVLYSIRSLKSSERHRAIMVNSGNANCANGPRGKQAVEQTVRALAAELHVGEKEILVCSTGIIGLRLPVLKIIRQIPRLVERLRRSGGHEAARAILTTDLTTKECAVSFRLGGREVRIGAMAKGAGMVHPNMATMLNFITTDCAIARPLLFRALRMAVRKTFNRISIDNDMSTNYTVFILANGQAGNRPVTGAGEDYEKFEDALIYVTDRIARELVRTGEGVTKFCELVVAGTRRPKDAELACRTIANSMLFKTMLAGADPNWGRIAAAVGASGIGFRFDRMHISFDGIKLLSNGKFLIGNRPEVRKVLRKEAFTIRVELGEGPHASTFYTSDLTKGYVHINASYAT